MRKWRDDTAYFVAIGLLVFFAIAPYAGLDAAPHPLVVSGFGALIGFVFARNERERQPDKDTREGSKDANHTR